MMITYIMLKLLRLAIPNIIYYLRILKYES
jgi:hypothetical protein